MTWISVNDKLPDYDVTVLWVREDGFHFLDDIDHDNTWENFKNTWENDDIMGVGGFGISFETQTVKVTHWMPLPEPPKQN